MVGRPPARRPKSKGDECCPMVAAMGAARRGRWRLARRYTAMSMRLIAERIS